MLLVCAVGSVSSAETDGNPNVTDGALQSSVWYDADQDNVVPVHVDPIADDSANRDSDVTAAAKTTACSFT